MMEDTQRRTGERAGHHHKGRPKIGYKFVARNKLGDKLRETNDEKQMKQRKSGEPDATRQSGRKLEGDK
jgi:hypothetical protein